MPLTIKIYNQYTKPRGKKQDAFIDVYEYEYIDKKTGELKKNKINTQEKIQSNLDKVNYKKMIERGELEINGNNVSEGIRDYTVVSGDKVDFIDFIAKVSRMDAQTLDKLVKDITSASQAQTEINRNQNGETTVKTPEVKPDNNGDTTKNNKGDEQ